MAARLQRTICLLVLLLAAVSLGIFGRNSPMLALTGAMLPVAIYAFVLGCEFLLLYTVQGRDAVARPTRAQMLRAWLSEILFGARVFFWRQPFRAEAVADHLPGVSTPTRGVVFVHGLFCNRGFWNPWMVLMRQSGKPYVAVNLEPLLGSIDDYAGTIDVAVRRLLAATGLPPVLICHSMGGLAVRAWLRQDGARARVARVITIGTPHGGTWMARFGHGENGSQMRLASAWLQALAAQETADHNALFTCWYSNCDNIVFPASTATLPGADNRLIAGSAHVALAFHPSVMRESLAMV